MVTVTMTLTEKKIFWIHNSLENAFRNFSTLTKGDNIEISYNDKIYGILVMEIKPEGVGISIVETDLEVDFAPPVGYQEPTPVPRSRPIMVRKRVSSEMDHIA